MLPMTVQGYIDADGYLHIDMPPGMPAGPVEVDITYVDEDSSDGELHSIMELRGLGAEIWKGIDAQEWVNQLRREWTRP